MPGCCKTSLRQHLGGFSRACASWVVQPVDHMQHVQGCGPMSQTALDSFLWHMQCAPAARR